ncbi:MAG: guanylate kinase [Candidatus Korobacteraceae bacterium]|jgi:guanylate kinase
MAEEPKPSANSNGNPAALSTAKQGRGLVFIISAPSGSGKSTLVNELRHSVEGLDFSISYTTRAPRGSEQNGREYCYLSRDEFEKMISADLFLEYADVFGNYYGTARIFLDRAMQRGNDLLLDIDVQGAAQLQAKLPDSISIFVLPPSRRELELRLRRRSSEENVKDPGIIRRRLDTASQEICNYNHYDYILVNDRLEDSIEALKAIVISERLRRSGHEPSGEVLRLAERCRLENVRESIQSILATFGNQESSAVRK